MPILPDYQKRIQTAFSELKSVVQKYSQPNSPIGSENAKHFSTLLTEAEKHCEHIFAIGKPRIMLYGTYNSGKSTLLNALMGKEIAPMGDVPTTYEKNSYTWKGYELVDTPGINAPVEHEKVSRESLKECQVILFVISSGGSHDDAKIYTAMKEVVDMGKKLFIVLNDKEGYEINSPEIRDIADSIQKNLEKVGVSPHEAASFNFIMVNARFGLDGCLNNDENLLQFSGIAELEQRMLQEIQRVKGFEIMADLCSYVMDKFVPFGECLTGLSSISGNEKMKNYYELHEDNGKFCTLLESRIDDKCATLPASIRMCFGRPAGQKSQEEVQSAIIKVYEDYNCDLAETYKTDLGTYLAGVAKRLNTIIDINAINAPHTDGKMDANRYEDMVHQHDKAMSDDKIVPQTGDISGSGADIMDILISGTTILDRIPLPKLPVPLPGPLGPLTIPVVVTVIKKLYDLFFGESEEDKRNRQIEAKIRAERENAERKAREMARYEAELMQYCQDLAMEFRNEAKRNYRKNLSGMMEPLFTQIRAELKKQTKLVENVLSDVNKVGEIMSSFETIRSDLKTLAI